MNDYCGNPDCPDPECPGLVGHIRCPNYPHQWDGLKHCVVTKQLKSSFVCMNWKFPELTEARAKVAELDCALNRRGNEYSIAIVSI